MTFITLDCETGGTDPVHSLLTADFIVLDHSLKSLGQLSLALKPNDGNYIVCGDAMAVNKINLVEHDKDAITYKEGGTKLWNWLNFMHSQHGPMTPMGQGIQGDINKVTQFLMLPTSWKMFCDPRCIELITLGKTLQYLGYIPETQSLALSNILMWFEVGVNLDLCHNSEYDAKLNVTLFERYLSFLA